VLGLAEERVRAFSLAAWGNVHTLVVLLGTGLAVGTGQPALLACGAACSFAILLVQTRGQWTPKGNLGVANAVTTLRVLMTLALLLGYARLPDEILAITAVVILLMDGLDGWLARHFGAASEFGARYDVEADALFVIALALVLLARGDAGLWVLIAGLWRYVYILARILFPTPTEAPRTLFGRVTYVVMLLSFILALLLPPAWGAPSAALGTLGVSISFIRSFWQCYAPQRAA
jgi:phosphatidylglycerophosphate synthase